MSTSGPASCHYGEALLGELAVLTEQGHTAVVKVHPRLRDERSAGRRWILLADRFASERLHIIGRSDDWAPYLAASDLAVADNTSLTTTYAALGRQIIPVALPARSILPGSFDHWLLENRRPLRVSTGLPKVMEMADEQYRVDGAPLDFAHKGQARESFRKGICRLAKVSGF